MVPFPREIADEEFAIVPNCPNESSGQHAAIYFDEMLMSCVSPDAEDHIENSYSSTTSAIEDDESSSMTTCTECDEVLDSLDELYSSEDDDLNEDIAMLETIYPSADQYSNSAMFGFGCSEFPRPMELPSVLMPSYTCGEDVVGDLPVLHAETIPDMDDEAVALEPFICIPDGVVSCQLV